MKTYVHGSGGREDALRRVIGRTAEVVSSPEDAEFIVVGPEPPLVAGYADEWRAKGKLVYGPGADGARLEGSKAFMKDFVARAGVPTARYGTFTDADEAIEFMKSLPPPYVVKTDGLAAGKGVLVTESLEEACDDIRAKLSGASFGDAGSRVIIEEGMIGPELSVMYMFDGKKGVSLAPAQDFKRIFDGNKGPNTGGMGAYSPVPIATASIVDQITERILEPTGAQLIKDGIDYRGTLYAGLMLTPDGPKLIEYNVRFGDPETQVILPLFEGDFCEALASVARGSIAFDTSAPSKCAVTITLASAGYPESSSNGDVITGIEDAEADPDVMVFKAGTASRDDALVTDGGRVLNVTAIGSTVADARAKAYAAVQKISFEGMQYRTDIAH